MKGVNEFTADQLKHWSEYAQTVDGWKLARPIGSCGIVLRLKKAWKVFTGKADVLIWHKQ
jgi:hypothetical protein